MAGHVLPIADYEQGNNCRDTQCLFSVFSLVFLS